MYGPNYGNNNPTTHRVEVQIPHLERKMGVDDKVEVKNIFQPGGSGHGDGVGGLGAMAAIAALGNRNDSRSNVGYGGDCFGGGLGGGLGAGLLGGVLGGLIFNRRDGFGGGDCGTAGLSSGQIIADGAILNGVNGLTAAVPTTALQTQAAIQSGISSLALGTQQGLANVKDAVQNLSSAQLVAIAGVKDSVQNSAALLASAICGVNTNILTTGCQIERTIVNDGDRTRALLTSRFQLEDQTKIQNLANEVIELRNEGRNRQHHDELRLQITNTNTAVAAQAQGQQQQQFQGLVGVVNSLVPAVNALISHSQIAAARATNGNVIVGNAGATTTGAQTATASPVNVAA